MRIAIIGRTQWLMDTANALVREGHRIALVATSTGQPEYKVQATHFADLAVRCGASYHFEPDVNAPAFASALRESRAEIGISVNWPKIIRGSAIAALPRGILNGHAGDLPRYRGNACPNWAILNGESHIGLCVHAIEDGKLDSGPVYVRRLMPLDDETYIQDVHDWMDEALPGMFVEALARCEDVEFTPQDQIASGLMPLRCYPRRPADGQIDWQQPAGRIARLVRASARPFAGAFSFLEQQTKVTIWRARVADDGGDYCAIPGQIMGRGARGGVLVACGTGTLEIEQAELADGRTLPVANSYRLTRHGGAS
jgi:UDP-4-amino-4-deoxy-L-arabinose formyltransferase/UDP-glucuronic acid dehydrogenase (UDP-4-keto-hexauronic acid decarboxylating)